MAVTILCAGLSLLACWFFHVPAGWTLLIAAVVWSTAQSIRLTLEAAALKRRLEQLEQARREPQPDASRLDGPADG